jgi:tRNA (guanosine-2'-O-)-methyltransferase
MTERRERRIEEAAAGRQQGAVVLEDIRDPHNAEAVFRSCEAFGFQRVCLIFEQEQPFDPQLIGKASSASANKWLSFSIYESTTDCLAELRAAGYEVLATVLDPSAESVYDARFDASRIAMLLGNEQQGLSEQALALADRKLTIPMRGLVQSLNLSVTAAICLYEITRQRLLTGMEQYALPQSERDELAARWLRGY